jgi:hypothetical protein
MKYLSKKFVERCVMYYFYEQKKDFTYSANIQGTFIKKKKKMKLLILNEPFVRKLINDTQNNLFT